MIGSTGFSPAAQSGLFALNGANQRFNDANDAISTGREVRTAADDPARFAIGALLQSDEVGYSAEARNFALKESTLAIDRARAEADIETARSSLSAQLVEGTLSGASGDELGAVLTAGLGDVEAAVDVAAEVGAQERSAAQSAQFLEDFRSAIAESVSSVLDADIEKEATRQQQSQVQQELALRSLSIVNQIERRSVSALF